MGGFVRSLNNERGKSKFATLLTIAVIIAVIYSAIQFVPPVVDYLKMKNIAYDVMNSVGTKGNDAILERLFRMAKKSGIEVDPENVSILQEEGGPATLVIDYSETVVVLKDKIEKTLSFHIEETAR
jgi:hypothetical protein